MYADYNYYINNYVGSSIPEESFAYVSKQASRYMDLWANIRNEADIVKDCCCEMAEHIYDVKIKNADAKEVKSENTDGYQVSYVTEGKDGESKQKTMERNLYAICRKYLVHTGAMYAGVRFKC